MLLLLIRSQTVDFKCIRYFSTLLVVTTRREWAYIYPKVRVMYLDSTATGHWISRMLSSQTTLITVLRIHSQMYTNSSWMWSPARLSPERFFSTVKRVHTSSRRSMTTERLNSLSILSFEREITQTLRNDPMVVINILKKRHC